jgi:hypothetical protein
MKDEAIESWCGGCRFFDVNTHTHDSGRCRRHSPVRMRVDLLSEKELEDETFIGRPEGEWPVVMTDDWCGDFEPSRSQEPPSP